MKLTLVKRLNETHDTESFYWKPDEPVDFRPGQYLKWTLEDDHPDDRGNSRFFSIASAPSEEYLMLATKFNAERSSSFKTTLKNLSEGDVIKGYGPLGSFVLPDEKSGLSTPQDLVLVAGGIGITPFRSMLKYMADSGNGQPVHLLYGCRTTGDIAFRQLLDEIAASGSWLKITYVVEAPEGDWSGETGRLDAERIQVLAGGLEDKLTYLSGPEPMIKAFKDDLLGLGVNEAKLLTDYFPNYLL